MPSPRDPLLLPPAGAAEPEPPQDADGASFPDDSDPSRPRLEKEILEDCHKWLAEDYQFIESEVDKLRGSRPIHYDEIARRYRRVARRTMHLRGVVEVLTYALVVGVPAVLLTWSLSAGVDLITALAAAIVLLALFVRSHAPPRAYQDSTSRQSALLALSSVVSFGVWFGLYNDVGSLSPIDLPIVQTIVSMTAIVSATGLVTVVLLHGLRDYCRRMSGYLTGRRADEQIVCEAVQGLRLLRLIEEDTPDRRVCSKRLVREKLAKIDRLLMTGSLHAEFGLSRAEKSEVRKRDQDLACDVRMWRTQVVTNGHQGRILVQNELIRLAAATLTDRPDQIEEDVARRRAARVSPSRAALRRAVSPAITGVLVLALVLLYRWLDLPDDPTITTVAVGGFVILVNALLSVAGTSDALQRRVVAAITSFRTGKDAEQSDSSTPERSVDSQPDGSSGRDG